MRIIPFVPLPADRAVILARPFLPFSNMLVKLTPELSLKLSQANIKLNDREYIAIAVFSSIFWFVLIFSIFFLLSAVVKTLPKNFIQIIFLSSFGISILSLIYVISYPSLLVTRKVRNVEKNLLFSLRHLLVQVKSGVPLSDALVSVSKGGYGSVSEELNKCMKNVATGKSLMDELEEVAMKNPSLYFRRAMWQIANSVKAGADVGDTLKILVGNLSEEQRVLIRKYGSQLNPLALMYMMLAVIIPTLGITFIITISSFSGLQVPQYVFYLILLTLAVFQFMFIGIVKSRRPAIGV